MLARPPLTPTTSTRQGTQPSAECRCRLLCTCSWKQQQYPGNGVPAAYSRFLHTHVYLSHPPAHQQIHRPGTATKPAPPAQSSRNRGASCQPHSRPRPYRPRLCCHACTPRAKKHRGWGAASLGQQEPRGCGSRQQAEQHAKESALACLSSHTACRHQTWAAVSPPSGASQNAWVYVCLQSTKCLSNINALACSPV